MAQVEKNFLSRPGTAVESRDASDGAHPVEVGVGCGLEVILADFFDAVDEAPTIGAIDEGLDVGRTEPEVGDDAGLTDPDRKPLKPRRGAYGLTITGNESSHR
ncbi:MAG: hypothetical protein CV081_11865 [Nitrospira sp. LK265]|nr:hypothetical protein [Nitrospira sp. LK265]